MTRKVAAAVHELVTKGCGIGEAARAAGMHHVSLSRAIHRPDIAAYLEQQKALQIQGIDRLRQSAKAAAINHGLWLMHNAQSEQIRAKMVELFAGEGKQAPQIALQFNDNRSGYEYVRPGQKLVEVRNKPAQDGASGGDDG